MKFLPLITLLALTACGADGAPTKPGISVSGEAQMGVTGGGATE